MGKKAKTGIGFVDNAVNSVVKGAQGLGNNIEANARNAAEDFGMLFSGNFNNLGTSAVRSAGAGLTFIANPDDLKRITGESRSQRAERESVEKAAANDAKDLANQNAEMLRQNAAVISGAVTARQRTPGKGMTLLTGAPGAGGSNTLLTVMGR